jgi:hypothetical protein
MKAVVTVLALFVAVQIGMVTLAVTTFEGPDEPGYYKMGLEHDRARQVRLSTNLPAQLPAAKPFALKASVPQGWPVTARIGRPATRSRDFELSLPGCWVPESGFWEVAFKVEGRIVRRQRVLVR